MFGRKNSIRSAGSLASPDAEKSADPAPAPTPPPICLKRTAVVTRVNTIVHGSYHQPYVYFSVLVSGDNTDGEDEKLDKQIMTSSVVANNDNGFALLAVGDQLAVTVSKNDKGDWFLKTFMILFDLEKERARLSAGQKSSTSALPPRHPLRSDQ